jgi:hypothetical protein
MESMKTKNIDNILKNNQSEIGLHGTLNNRGLFLDIVMQMYRA